MQPQEIQLSFSCHCGFMKCKTKQKASMLVSSDSPLELTVLDCNCSMCRRKGFLHHIVSENNFELTSPNNLSQLQCYSFQTHVAKHYFCPVCGICTFYKPRSNPDGWSVNFRCLDDESVPLVKYSIEPFDGQNWEENGAKIKHLSE